MRSAIKPKSQHIKPTLSVVCELQEPELIHPLERVKEYPILRYMGSKRRLLPWIYDVLCSLEFETALDPFSGSGCVAYLIKSMGKRVVASDFLNFSATLAKATIENNKHKLDGPAIKTLLCPAKNAPNFIEKTYKGIFYTPRDLRFLDQVSNNINLLGNSYQKAIAMSALIRACLKKQPRGVFTVSGDLSKYDVVGDIDAIIRAKRQDTKLLLVTDGLTWKQRQNDLSKLVERQNNGEITRIYTTAMRSQLESDLRIIKSEFRI